MEYVHKTAGLRQFATNESSFKVQGFTMPPHTSDMEIISFANSKVLSSNYTQMRKLERCFDAILTDEPPAPEAVIEMSLCKCKTGCSTMWCKCKKNCVQKCVYVLDTKTLLFTRIWSAQVHIMTMVKIMECKIKWTTEQDKQVWEYVWNSIYITNDN